MKARILTLLLCFSSLLAVSQVPTDTNSLRNRIKTDIVPNGSGGITAAKLNNILTGIVNLMKAYALDSAYRVNDTLFLTRRGGYTTIKVTLASGGVGSESDPTVPSAVKSINSTDISNWNSKQPAITNSATVSIIANVVQAANGTALWNANQLQGRAISSTAPTTNQVLTWNGSAWVPADPTGGGGGSDGNNYSTGLSFNVASGILQMTRFGLATISVDLDGKYVDSIVRENDSVTAFFKSGTVLFRDTAYSLLVYNSIEAVGARGIQLKNDQTSPGANKVYGTDASGVKGWKNDPAGGGSPAGTSTELQYRNGSSFGAMAGSLWDNTNRKLSLIGSKTDGATYGLLFSDTLTPTAGSAKTRYWMAFDPIHNHSRASRFAITTSATAYTGVGISDNVVNIGWNISPGGGVIQSGRGGSGFSLENWYVPSVGDTINAEIHTFFFGPDDVQRRLESWTIRHNWNGSSIVYDKYFTASRIYNKRPETGQVWLNSQQNGDGASVGLYLPDGTRGVVIEADTGVGLQISPVGGGFGFDGVNQTFSVSNFPITETVGLRIANNNIRVKGSSPILYPENNNVANLGDPSYKWANLWATTIGGLSTPVTNLSATNIYLPTLDSVGVNGGFLFRDASTGKIRVTAAPSGGGGGGTTYFASNGLTKVSDTMRLGGTLWQNTTINNAGFSLTISGAGQLYTQAPANFRGSVNVETPDQLHGFSLDINNAGQLQWTPNGGGFMELIASSWNAFTLPGMRTSPGGIRINGSGAILFPENDNSSYFGDPSYRWLTGYFINLGTTGTRVTNYYGTNINTNGTLTLNSIKKAVSPSYLITKQSDSTVTEATPSEALNIILPSQTGNSGTVLTTNGTSASWGSPNSFYLSGTYTPTLTSVANVTGTPTVTTCYYQQIGDVIEVWGEITVDPTTTATLTQVRISLPFSSGFSNTYDLVGSATTENLVETMRIKADVANSAALLTFTPVDVTNRTAGFRFKYKYSAP